MSLNTQNITMQQIADALKVHVMTVSRALRDSPSISQKIKDKIKKYAEQVNYRPNAVARSLRSSRTGHIGLVVPNLINPYYAFLAEHIHLEARKQSFIISIMLTGWDETREEDVLNELLAKMPEGVILIPSRNSVKGLHGNHPLLTMKPPLVLLGKIVGLNRFFVGTNREAEIEHTINYLISKGRKRILIFHKSLKKKASNRVDVKKNKKVDFISNLTPGFVTYEKHPNDLNWDEKKIFRDFVSFFDYSQSSGGFDYDAIVASNDFVAVFIISFLLKNGIKVPGDVAVTGYDDVPLADISPVPITTWRRPYEKIAQEMVSAIVQKKQNGRYFFKSEMVIRESA